MRQGFRLAGLASLVYAAIAAPSACGQQFGSPADQKGAIDAEIWSGGILAQQDSSASFHTHVWLGGVRLGRILSRPHGPRRLRGTLQWDVGLGPAVVFSPRQTAYGFEVEPIIGRWNFVREGRAAPYLEISGGMIFTNVNVPPGDTSSVNVVARAGFGWRIIPGTERSFDVGLYGWHLSNAWTGNSNPSANGLDLAIGYHWFAGPGATGDSPPAAAVGRHESPEQAAKSAVQQSQRDAAGTAPPLNAAPAAASGSQAGGSRAGAAGRNEALESPAITGAPGMFTVETGEVLPAHSFAAYAYVNRFARAPGSVNILSSGFGVSAGLTKKLMLLAQFEPYVHVHPGAPSELSLNFPPGCVHDVFKAPIYCEVPAPPNPHPVTPIPPQSSWKGPAAAYVPGFPFVARSMSDYGPLDLGLKVNFWSEQREDPLSVSLRADFFIPTESAAAELAKRGVQTGALDYSFTLGLSRTFRHRLVAATNATYLVTGNPKANGETLLTPGDQIVFGQGFMFPISRRLQLLTEYTAVFFQEGHGFGLIGIDTQNTSRGPGEPVDGVWGVRWNLRAGMALDLGYRYMLNLHEAHDRSGFVFELSSLFRR